MGISTSNLHNIVHAVRVYLSVLMQLLDTVIFFHSWLHNYKSTGFNGLRCLKSELPIYMYDSHMIHVWLAHDTCMTRT